MGSSPVCNDTSQGLLYLDDTDYNLHICKGTSYGWIDAGFWTKSGSNLYPRDTTWRVGIGTTNPGGYKLRVSGGISVSDFSFFGANVYVLGNLGIGFGNPPSKLGVKGSASIGLGYVKEVAPTNGMIIQGNVGIGTKSPSSKLDVVGDIHCTGKLTSDGGNDPPYVAYSMETRKAIIERVEREILPEKRNQAVLFWNEETDRFEVYLPAKGEFRDLQGQILARREE